MESISVIIPTYNRKALLKKAIDSVLNQSYQEFELIIIDDGSTDETKELIRKYNNRVCYVFQENKGPSFARNQGIKTSKADYIAFLDSDDWWDKDKLKIQYELMQENKDCLISHTQEIWHKDGKIFNQKKKHKKYSGNIFDKCLPICAVSMSTVMIKRELFDEVGFFDESLPCCEDYDFWLRVSPYHSFLLIDKPLTLKDGGRPDQVSTRLARCMDKYRIYSIQKMLKTNNLDCKHRDLAIKELVKKCRIYGKGCIKYGRREEGREYLNIAKEFNKQ